jgi:lysophospholipase L1-like esterase
MMRHIRLKEWGANEDCLKRPEEKYVADADGSLALENFRLRTDENGFIRSGEIPPINASRVVVMGDSVPENIFVHENKRMCAVLERRFLEEGKAVSVLNGGMSGATTLHLINSFLTKVIPLRPKVVVVMNGIIDIDATLSRGLFWSKNNYITPLVSEDKSHKTEYTSSMEMSARMKLLQSFSAIAAIHDIPLIFTTIPHRSNPNDPYIKRKYPDLTYFQKKVFERNTINAQTREYCRDRKIKLIDLETDLKEKNGLFYDEFHMNENGSAVVADIIHRKIFLLVSND